MAQMLTQTLAIKLDLLKDIIAAGHLNPQRTMQPLHPFGLFKAGLGGVLAVVIAFFTIGGIYGLMRFGAIEKGFGNLWGVVDIFWMSSAPWCRRA
jgi:hypothetical protein